MLKTELKALNGEVLMFGEKPLTLGLAVAQMLAGTKSNDALRSWTLSTKFYAEEDFELNDSDKQFINQIIDKSEMWTPLVLGQVKQLLK